MERAYKNIIKRSSRKSGRTRTLPEFLIVYGDGSDSLQIHLRLAHGEATTADLRCCAVIICV